jgi:hypothetical protein
MRKKLIGEDTRGNESSHEELALDFSIQMLDGGWNFYSSRPGGWF